MKTTRLFRPSHTPTQPATVDHGPRRRGSKRGTAERFVLSTSPRLVVAAIALGMCSTVTFAPQALADPPAKVSCDLLAQIRESLDDDLSGGIDGVRRVISSPYSSGSWQRRDAESNLAMVNHGLHYIQDLNGNNAVPGLAPLLDKFDRAGSDMKDAVDSLFQVGGGGWGGGWGYGGINTSLAWPVPSTWAAIDYADQKKNDIYGLINNLQGPCPKPPPPPAE